MAPMRQPEIPRAGQFERASPIYAFTIYAFTFT